MNLILFFPKENEGAPLSVAKHIANYLNVYRNNLNFNVKLLFEEKRPYDVITSYETMDKSQLKYLNPKEDIIHFPLTPSFAITITPSLFNYFYNRKFKIISNVHGDVREELYYRLKNGSYSGSSFPVINYFFWPKLIKKSHCIIVNSKYTADILKQKYNISKSVKIIPNGIDKINYLRNRKIKTFEQFSIFSHGRLAIEKGYIPLVEAMENTSNDAKLYIAGDGPLKKKLQRIINSKKLWNCVELLGHISKEEIKVYLQSVNMAIYCSVYEPFSLAVLEALSNVDGPVFFSKKTGLYTFADKNEKRDLLTFNPTSYEINRIIENISSIHYNNVHMIQKQFAEKFEWNKIIHKYIEMYDQVFKS
jgi:glycosyltransferase involved in cell wall biosynthesis